MAYQLSNSSVLCVSFAIFGQDSPRQNGGVVWTGLSGCRWHVQKNNKKLKQKPKTNFKYKIYSCSHAAAICFCGPFGQWMKSTRIVSPRLVSFRLSICTICECSFIFRVFVDVTFNGVWATTDSSNICNCFSMEMTLKLVSTKKRKRKADAKRQQQQDFLLYCKKMLFRLVFDNGFSATFCIVFVIV